MIADTSFLFSLFVSDDSNHGKAQALYEKCRLEGSVIRVPEEVVAELYTSMAYKVGREEANLSVSSLFTDASYEILAFAYQKDILTYLKEVKAKISYVDAVVIFRSIPTKEQILSFDQQLLRQV